MSCFLCDIVEKAVARLVAAYGEKAWLVVVAAVCILVPFFSCKKCCGSGNCAEISTKRREARDSVVHKSLNLKPANTVDLSMDAHDLQDLYRTDKIKVVDAVNQCCNQSHSVGNAVLTAVTEELYDEAHDLAVQLDGQSPTERAKNINSLPLWGIPISIKDCVQQKGTDATCGSAAKCFKPFQEDGLQVTMLRNAGAVLHVRSNVPQLLMMPESENNIWGCSKNPWDKSRTPGGSSGGEAALVASGCSVMGLGSDIGGSIRIPAHYCGLVGFKPTPMRVTSKGSVVPRYLGRNGQMIIKPTVGPLTRSVRDCISMMEALTVPLAAEVDKFLPPLPPWNTSLSKNGPSDVTRPLRIGMVLSDDWFEAAEACQRAVRLAGKALSEQGFEVVPYHSKFSAWKMIEIYLSVLSADGNWYNHMKALEGEDLYESYKKTRLYTDLPVFLKSPAQFILKAMGEHRKAHGVSTMKSGGLNVREYWDRIADMNEYMKGVDAEWTSLGLDGIIMPTTGLVATPHGMAAEVIFQLSYTFYANLLHVPAGSVPVTTVQGGEDRYDSSKIPSNQRDSVAKLAHKVMEGSTGMPVGVQVVTPMWRDELCVHIMGCIEKGVGFNATCPILSKK